MWDTVGLQQVGAQLPSPQLPNFPSGRPATIWRLLENFFFFWEESCKSLRAAPGLRVTISCLEERIISPLEHEAPPTPGLTLGLQSSGTPAPPAQRPAGNWHLQHLLCLKRILIFSLPQEARGEVIVTASPGQADRLPVLSWSRKLNDPYPLAWLLTLVAPASQFPCIKGHLVPSVQTEVWDQQGGQSGAQISWKQEGRTSSVPLVLTALYSVIWGRQ